jgi:hypothetical protein
VAVTCSLPANTMSYLDSPDTFSSLDDQFSAIQEEMLRIEEQVMQLGERHKQLAIEMRSTGTRRNALAPLCRLPTEILDYILLRVVQDANPAFHMSANELLGPNHPPKGAGPVFVFQTCTHLRAHALSSPYAWTYVDINHRPSWIRLCQQRAGTHPLSVSCYSHWPLVRADAYALLKRAQDVYIKRAGDDDLHRHFHSAASPGSHERSLILLKPHVDRQDYIRPFSCNKPSSLTKLVLRGVNFPLSNLELPNLIELGLQQVHFPAGQNILQVVQTAGSLKHLFLDNLHWDPTPLVVETLQLSDLTSLYVRGPGTLVQQLLRALPDPSSKLEIHVMATQEDNTSSADSTLLQREILQRAMGKQATPLHLHHTEDSMHVLLCSRMNGCEIEYSNRCKSILGLRALLHNVQSLNVHGTAVTHLFQFVMPAPSAEFHSLKDIRLDTAHLNAADCLVWLRARAAARQRVSRLEFITFERSSADHGPLICNISDEQLVDEVHKNGILIWKAAA